MFPYLCFVRRHFVAEAALSPLVPDAVEGMILLLAVFVITSDLDKEAPIWYGRTGIANGASLLLLMKHCFAGVCVLQRIAHSDLYACVHPPGSPCPAHLLGVGCESYSSVTHPHITRTYNTKHTHSSSTMVLTSIATGAFNECLTIFENGESTKRRRSTITKLSGVPCNVVFNWRK